METLNRPTASMANEGIAGRIPATGAERLASLRAQVRRLWDLEPDAQGYERERLITALIDLEVDLERLAYRPELDRLACEDAVEFARCQAVVRDLKSRWRRVDPDLDLG